MWKGKMLSSPCPAPWAYPSYPCCGCSYFSEDFKPCSAYLPCSRSMLCCRWLCTWVGIQRAVDTLCIPNHPLHFSQAPEVSKKVCGGDCWPVRLHRSSLTSGGGCPCPMQYRLQVGRVQTVERAGHDRVRSCPCCSYVAPARSVVPNLF